MKAQVFNFSTKRCTDVWLGWAKMCSSYNKSPCNPDHESLWLTCQGHIKQFYSLNIDHHLVSSFMSLHSWCLKMKLILLPPPVKSMCWGSETEESHELCWLLSSVAGNDSTAQQWQQSIGLSWMPLQQNSACNVQHTSVDHEWFTPSRRRWGSCARIAYSSTCIQVLHDPLRW